MIGYGSTMPAESEQERVVAWLRHPREATATSPTTAAEDVVMPPMVVTIPRARREALLRAAGWRPVNLQFLLTGYDGAPLTGYVCFLQFLGAGGEENTARSDVRGGTATFPRFLLKPDGVLRLMCATIVGSANEDAFFLDASVTVPSALPRGYGSFRGVQDHRDVQVTASTSQQVAEAVQLQGSAKFTILGVAEIGGGGGTTTTGTNTGSRQLSWTVRLPRPSMQLTPLSR